MEFERRVSGIELRAEGRRLSGVVMRYRATSARATASGSSRARFGWPIRSISTLHHDPERAIAWHPGGGLEPWRAAAPMLTMRAELPPIPAADRALAEIKAGRVDGLSVEFRACASARTAGFACD